MNLTATTHALEVSIAAASGAVDWLSSWTEIDKSGASTAILPGSDCGSLSGAAVATVVAAPTANKYRTVTSLVVRNKEATATHTVTVKKDVSGTEYVLIVVTLYAGETLVYEDGRGWEHFDANGLPKVNALQAGAKSAVMMADHFATANLTSAKTITSGSTFALYVGKAPRSLTSVQLRLRVTTAMATITWGEVAIAKGPLVVGGNPSLTVVGWADVSASYNSLGQKTTTINVSTGQAINEGDDLWVLIGNAATTALQVRAQSIADDLQVGGQASLATRPSLNVGAAQTYTIEGATTLAAWVALLV